LKELLNNTPTRHYHRHHHKYNQVYSFTS